MPRTPDDIPYSNPTTSLQAAEQMTEAAPNMRAQALTLIQQCSPGGITDERLEDETGMKHQTLSARRNELMHVGLIVDSGQREENRSGSDAILWVTTSLVTEYHLRTGDISGLPILPQYRKDKALRVYHALLKLTQADLIRVFEMVRDHVC